MWFYCGNIRGVLVCGVTWPRVQIAWPYEAFTRGWRGEYAAAISGPVVLLQGQRLTGCLRRHKTTYIVYFSLTGPILRGLYGKAIRESVTATITRLHTTHFIPSTQPSLLTKQKSSVLFSDLTDNILKSAQSGGKTEHINEAGKFGIEPFLLHSILFFKSAFRGAICLTRGFIGSIFAISGDLRVL